MVLLQKTSRGLEEEETRIYIISVIDRSSLSTVRGKASPASSPVWAPLQDAETRKIQVARSTEAQQRRTPVLPPPLERHRRILPLSTLSMQKAWLERVVICELLDIVFDFK